VSAPLDRHAMPFGAQLQTDGTVRFQLWAPQHAHIELLLWPSGHSESDTATTTLPMHRDSDGWHQLLTDQARAGTLYKYRLPDGLSVPDPASRFQPQDIHGPSEVIDPAVYRWNDSDWQGRPWNEAVIYELHIGCFTAEGSFRAAVERLDHLVRLGVTAIEVMPVADFPGQRNWGYDGVLLFAPDASYGRPEEFKAFIDAAHARGLMLILDVVYNHFGPEGNYLSAYAPQFFNARHQTPWGAAVNVDAEDSHTVREFIVQNALYWLEEFHIDGLRLDAVHAIRDDSDRHLLTELAQRLHAAGLPRRVHLILENEHNEASWLAPGLFSAQWNDDVHHVLHVAASGEREGYYADYLDNGESLARALAQGFAFQGEVMPYRGSARGEACAHLSPERFVAFIQNHDQIGNRALGERLSAIAPAAAVRAVSAVYLLLPQIPMLFMGEEWQSARPFQFFCDFGGELAQAVRAGRRQEFSRFAAFQSERARESIPDPLAESTFQASKLDWEALSQPAHAAGYLRYQQLLQTRSRHIVPLLPTLTRGGDYRVIAHSAVLANWVTSSGSQLTLLANLSAQSVAGFPDTDGQLLWQEGLVDSNGRFAPWSVRWILRT
jgi:maltooligosyltrehalose trehalohydrolase